MKKFNNQFCHIWAVDLKRRQSKAIKDQPLRWKPLKSNFQKLLLMLGKIFCYFLVTLNNFKFELHMHHRFRVCTG